MNNDLVSRDKVLDIIRPRLNSAEEGTLERQRIHSIFLSVQKMPTACDADKAVEQLESVSIPEDKILYSSPDGFGVYVLLEDAVRIIREMEGQVS